MKQEETDQADCCLWIRPKKWTHNVAERQHYQNGYCDNWFLQKHRPRATFFVFCCRLYMYFSSVVLKTCYLHS